MTMWQAADEDQAIWYAEQEVRSYAGEFGAEFVGFSESFRLSDPPASGAEVFSLVRASRLTPRLYVDRYFDTGHEARH